MVKNAWQTDSPLRWPEFDFLMTNALKRYKVKAFGVTRDILEARDKVIETEARTVGDLKAFLLAQHPALGGLRSLFIAVNNAYAEDDMLLTEGDEIALIPPVSGG